MFTINFNGFLVSFDFLYGRERLREDLGPFHTVSFFCENEN